MSQNIQKTREKFIKNSKIIFTNTQNRDEFTSELFNDRRTDTLWYNNGKTWMDLLNLYNPIIFFPRFDQSINIFINNSKKKNPKILGKM